MTIARRGRGAAETAEEERDLVFFDFDWSGKKVRESGVVENQAVEEGEESDRNGLLHARFASSLHPPRRNRHRGGAAEGVGHACRTLWTRRKWRSVTEEDTDGRLREVRVFQFD